jgi:transposase
MDVIVERVGALDVHKAQVRACVRVPEKRGRASEVAEFKTTVRGLLVLRDWLVSHGVTQVAMEATGDYWRPVWHVLEDDFELLLVNARHVKQVPGRKTDVKDAEWLCQLAEAGLLRASFVPPKPIRDLRQLTRYRKAQIQERQREANRLHKALEDSGIKLDCVATDILGVSGRLMLDALVSGTTDPEVLAELARGKLRRKLPALREALEGRFDSLHALLVGSILAHLDFLDEQIERLSDALEQQLGPFAPAVELLRTIPGVERRTAEVIVAEIGSDMSVFPTAGHLASWGGAVPRQPPVGRQTHVGTDAQGLEVAQPSAQGRGHGRAQNQRQLPAGALPSQEVTARPRPRPGRRQALDHLCLLADAHNRRALHRARRRLLRPPRPRPADATPHRPARTPRPHRHPARGRLTLVIFPSVFLAGEAGFPRRVKMVQDRGVVCWRRGFLGALEPVLQFDVGASPGSRACRCERAP